MAVYRIYPSKDASIYSKTLTSNTGADSMLEVGRTSDGYSIRSLIEFDQEEINDVISNIMPTTASYSASLNLAAAVANEIPTDMKLDIMPISESWTEGVGYFGDVPATVDGVSWKYVNGVASWVAPGGTFVSSISSNYPNGVFVPTPIQVNISGSYTHTYRGSVDLLADVTPFVRATFHGEIENNGLAVKLAESEFITGSILNVKYFSSDSNTIYYPYLEFGWDDSTDGTTLTELDNEVCDIIFKNIKKEYTDEGKVRVRLHAREKYPTKTYRTTSVYLDNKVLPVGSTWGVKDMATGEMVVDFDTFKTRLSRDDKGSYFDFYMDILNVERYYTFLVQTEIDGTKMTVESDKIFKVVDNG
jgi:hypothetical protein